MRRRAPSRSRQGFTLVELMVACALLGTVAAGMFSGLSIISRAQATAATTNLAQAGARAALNRLARDVQMVGAGCPSGSLVDAAGGSVPVLVVTDSATGPDRLDLLTVDPAAQATATSPLDVVTSFGVDDPSAFHVGDAIQMTDLGSCSLLSVTSVGTSALGVPIRSPSAHVFPAGSIVFRSRAVSWYVDSVTFGAGEPLLMLDPDGSGPQPAQPFAEGIEDLQIALGIDANGDGAIASLGAAPGDDEWIFNVPGETAPASLAQLRAVRITVVARATSSLGGVRGQRPAAEDRPGAPTPDAFPRRVLRTEIAVRNLGL